jgi:hypothetical protein
MLEDYQSIAKNLLDEGIWDEILKSSRWFIILKMDLKFVLQSGTEPKIKFLY